MQDASNPRVASEPDEDVSTDDDVNRIWILGFFEVTIPGIIVEGDTFLDGSEALGINATGEVAGIAFDFFVPVEGRLAFLWTPEPEVYW